MSSLKILITAGPTIEPIDPVRFISNHSSGKMGYALAEAAAKLGHSVTLVSGPVHLPCPTSVKRIEVKTAQEMQKAVLKISSKMDVIIKAAAVGDYRVEKLARHKIKKTQDVLTVRLVKNPDILKKLGEIKKTGHILVGFAAETQNWEKNALSKLKKKNCDWLVLNNVAQKGIGFGSDNNAVTLYSQLGEKTHFSKSSKKAIARKILRKILAIGPL